MRPLLVGFCFASGTLGAVLSQCDLPLGDNQGQLDDCPCSCSVLNSHRLTLLRVSLCVDGFVYASVLLSTGDDSPISSRAAARGATIPSR